jgi:hypothetical protein
MLKPCTITIVVNPEEGETMEKFRAYVRDIISQVKGAVDCKCMVEVDLNSQLHQAGLATEVAAKRMSSTDVRDPNYPSRVDEYDAACKWHLHLAKLSGLV